MDFARYGSAADPDPANTRRPSRDSGLDRDWDGEPKGGQRSLPARERPWGDDPLEQRLDRWVHRGRQLVDGVSGARPGSRQAPPPGANRPGGRGAGIDGLGRWMGNRFDWLLDDGDDWREPWQEADSPRRRDRFEAVGRPAPASRGVSVEGTILEQPGVAGDPPLPRRRLEAVSLRGRNRLSANPAAASGASQLPPQDSAARKEPDSARPLLDESDDWPEDTVFKLDRWQRPSRQGSGPSRDPEPLERDSPSGRPLPRSTRRR